MKVWLPVGDVSVEEGGLVYLEGSHEIGRQMDAEFNERAAQRDPQERISAYNRIMDEGGWVTSDLPAMAEKFNRRGLYAN